MPSNPKKRARERPSADADMFAIWEDLANENYTVRINATVRLLYRLNSPGDQQQQELDKALKRLIRGLCSGRKAARLGFSVALTELLSQRVGGPANAGDGAPGFTLSGVVALLAELTKTSGQMPGQEARDHYLGRVFGAEAVVQSGVAFAHAANEDEWFKLVQMLLELVSKKPWLREECGWVFYLSLEKLKPQPFGRLWVEKLLQELSSNGLVKTPEGVALWVSAVRLFPKVSLPKYVFDGNDPLMPRNRKLLLRILKEETTKAQEDGEKQGQRGSWSSRPHFAWDVIFRSLLESKGQGDFSTFWREVVDDGLFASTASSERKHWGLSLFSQTTASLPATEVSGLLSTNLVKCIANQIAGKDRYLNAAADRAVKAIVARIEAEPSLSGRVLQKLLGPELRSTALLPALRGRLCDRVLALSDLAGLEATCESVVATFEGSGQTIAAAEARSLLDVFGGATRTRPYPSDGESLERVRSLYGGLLEFLAKAAYYALGNSRGSPSPLPPGVKEAFRSRLSTLLTVLATKEADASHYATRLLFIIDELERSLSEVSPLDEQIKKRVRKALQSAMKLEKLSAKGSKHAQALALLFSSCILQVYNAEPDALDAIEDLQNCYRGITAAATTDSTEGERELEQEQARAADAMVEVLLSFTSKPPVMLKNLAQQTFSLCTDIVTANGIASMLDVLKAKEDMSGQNDMFEAQEANENLDEDVDGADDSDVEMLNGDGDDPDTLLEGDDSSETSSQASSEEGSSDGGEDDDEEEEEDDNNGNDNDEDAELQAFDAKLAQALGTRRADDDLAHAEAESSDSDMDDAQMEALDGHLSAMFQQRKQAAAGHQNRKKERKDARETVVVFKTRVLDLLRAYIERQALNPLALDLLVPLLTLIDGTRNKAVSEKAAGLVRDFSRQYNKLAKGGAGGGGGSGGGSSSSSSGGTPGKALSLMAEVHEMVADEKGAAASSSSSNRFHTACSQASLLLARIHLAAGGAPDELLACYARTERRFATDSHCAVRVSFFVDWLNWSRQTMAR